VSSVEVTQAYLDRIADVDSSVGAYLARDDEQTLQAARDADARRQSGEDVPELTGVPIAVKDNIVTRGLTTTCGSKVLEGWEPVYDATVVERLRKAGLPILGKSNRDECAMGSATEFSAFHPTHNPWDLQRHPGGSGGGSAAALAALSAPLALGSDTGGSIRQPGAVTGTVGVKPSYGGVSRYGAVALASSLDQVGPAARTVLDAALLHEVIGGHDPRDGTSLPDAVPPVVAAAKEGATGDLRGVLLVSSASYRARATRTVCVCALPKRSMICDKQGRKLLKCRARRLNPLWMLITSFIRQRRRRIWLALTVCGLVTELNPLMGVPSRS